MYTNLHSVPEFCTMGFGPDFPVKAFTDEEGYTLIEREVKRSWESDRMGDFAVGFYSSLNREFEILGRELEIAKGDEENGFDHGEVRLVEGDEYKALVRDGRFLSEANVEWVGYAGVRDGNYSMPLSEQDDMPRPELLELIELRYGVSPMRWGQGIAPEAARSVMRWAAAERGVKRFIAETEKENTRSGIILMKMGFSNSDTRYWGEDKQQEWEKWVFRRNSS
jgi:RimJ/RimL family protein N-acetyltransferase